ncbi:aldose 1-epimerase [Bacteroidia bacterium]|nr:aldose 1-epimerase [Bacteroidia bacterium]
MKKTFLISTIVAAFAPGCANQQQTLPLVEKSAFDTVIDGQPVSLYTLKSKQGLVAQVTNYGLRVVSLWAPDKNGKYEDVVIGYANINEYVHNKGERFLGCIVGRYANRVAQGKFSLDGKAYQLPQNNGANALHGGLKGLDGVVWKVDNVSSNAIQFSYTSPDGDEGFPGTLSLVVDYTLTDENSLQITYHATTDKPTVVNLSNHSFFNLKGEGNDVTDHVLQINAGHITPVDASLIPTGEIASVEGTPLDFRTPTVIGARINNDDTQLKHGGGYDHNWIIDHKTAGDVTLAAALYEPESGRVMEVYTDQPGIQFYAGNFFDGKGIGKHGKPIAYRESLALETQKFPDSPNHANFPSTRLNPGEVYTQTCIYKFLVKK